MALTGKYRPAFHTNRQNDFASFAGFHRFIVKVSNFFAGFISVVYLSFFSDFYSSSNHPHIR